MKKFCLIIFVLIFFLSGLNCKKSQEEPKTKGVEKGEKKVTQKMVQDSRMVESKDATLKIVASSGNVFGIDLTNKIPVRGVQFTVEKAKITEVRTTSRTEGFLAEFNKETGIVIMVSAVGNTIAAGTGFIAEIVCDKEDAAVVLSDIKIAK